MELWIFFKGNHYTLLINTDTNEFSVMLGMKDVTGEFSEDELYYIFKNKDKLAV